MSTATYIDIRNIADFPSFHDAELYGIEHDPKERVLELRFRRVGGELEALKFSGVIAQRMIDFAGQNVASRLLISHRYAFTLVEVRRWIQWINSRDDSKAALISEEQGQDYKQDFAAGRRMLFVLEPSCGAELAVLCESVSLRQ
ncbi:hypothetical protein [Paraburkholderia bannensis]|uniref:hypothetical protein n=1 Tax=Paraburkholderia bannensis TaxID=765414 RepID=UPI002ABE7217|nr:hypothetical protein [Paraburkholderia bannensis]